MSKMRFFSRLLPLLLLSVLLTGVVKAQMDVRMHHYMLNCVDFNPGYSGSRGLVNIYAFGRQQWIGFGDGAPHSIFLNFDIPFGYKNMNQLRPGYRMQYSHGLGVHLYRDEVGFLAKNGGEINYAGRFHLRAIGSLSFGVGFRFINDKFDAKWRSPDAAEQDPAIPMANANGVNFDLSFGLFFTAGRGYFGISGQNLLGGGVRDKIAEGLKSSVRVDYAREYYVVAGYDVALPRNWSIEPSFLYRTDLVQHSASVTVRAMYNGLVWFGVGYYVMEGIGGLVGVNLFNGLHIGYSYDYPLSGIRHYTSGSHEIVLGYSFSLIRERKPQQYKSVRYL